MTKKFKFFRRINFIFKQQHDLPAIASIAPLVADYSHTSLQHPLE
jgi:hypothetical protein